MTELLRRIKFAEANNNGTVSGRIIIGTRSISLREAEMALEVLDASKAAAEAALARHQT